ncbi:MAG: hypothetical protein AB1641_01730 [Thermodesulfobacteriota bacterium]
MDRPIPKILFDPQDYELLNMVNDIRNREESRKYLKKLFEPYLHPDGIKEMAAPKDLRIAYAVTNLLGSLEAGKASDRLGALRSVKDEVLHTAQSYLRVNTARVLLQIMKELIRAQGDFQRQLELAHDFRTVAAGKPRKVRAMLQRYHLLEMPEEWNQIAFDHHVHDANTKGRKTPTHLVMDAWIKGIRRLTVVYYNHVRTEAVAELMEAAEIMGLKIRVGVELAARFHDRYVFLFWEPRGFSGPQNFIQFLTEGPVAEFMAEGRKVSEYQQAHVLRVLQEFNNRHRLTLNETFDLDLQPLAEGDFLAFVGLGQPSLLHLARYIYNHVVPALETRAAELRERYDHADPEERQKISHLVNEMGQMDSETIHEKFLRPESNPALPNPHVPRDGPEVPDLLKLASQEILNRIGQFRAGYRITLNLSDLTVEDVIELLYDCQGKITHLEIFNLKDYTAGKTAHQADISELQRVINQGNVIRLKKTIRGIIQRVEESGRPDAAERVQKLTAILHDIATLKNYYKDSPLKSRIGSDSTGRSRHLPGMGLVIKNTLPARVSRQIDGTPLSSFETIPVKTEVHRRATFMPPPPANTWLRGLQRLVNRLPGLGLIGMKGQVDWVVKFEAPHLEKPGNIAMLGGVRDGGERGNGYRLDQTPPSARKTEVSWSYLNTGLKNLLKVIVGFIPAFLTFALTKDWWLLAYFGAVIWFGITGLRNILQSVLGGGGLGRSPALTWRNYISWERIADSLLYTGFSVPLLDYLTKTLLLDQALGINTTSNPLALYSVMALVNGIYISGHNVWRGLPRGAIVGNFFRSVLSIPLALVFNSLAGAVLGSVGVTGVNAALQKWAAIISKAASDCVAGLIEGAADRRQNISMRSWDYDRKLGQLFDTYAKLELLFPDADVLEMLASPKALIRTLSREASDLEKILIINALDLLYFWMYQPRARGVLKARLKSLSEEERQILERSQTVLHRHKEVSQIFVDGLVGKKFSRALSFFLDRSEEYLRDMRRLVARAASGGGPYDP